MDDGGLAAAMAEQGPDGGARAGHAFRDRNVAHGSCPVTLDGSAARVAEDVAVGCGSVHRGSFLEARAGGAGFGSGAGTTLSAIPTVASSLTLE